MNDRSEERGKDFCSVTFLYALDKTTRFALSLQCYLLNVLQSAKLWLLVSMRSLRLEYA